MNRNQIKKLRKKISKKGYWDERWDLYSKKCKEWNDFTRLCALSLPRREAIAFLLSIYSNTYPKMPKTGSIRVEAKNSTLISTSGHDTATPLVFDSLEMKDLLEFTDHLGGEDAIRRLSVVLDYPEEDYAADLAMRGLLHYYYNVSYLVDRLKEMVAVSRAAQRRGKKTRKEVVK